MAAEVFVDTGAWFACQVSDDRWHLAAADSLRDFVRRGTALVTTNWVVGETYSLLVRTHGTRAALSFLNVIDRTVRLTRVHADQDTESAAVEILREYDDQRFSFVDAISFAVMRSRRIREAFAFDRHFAIAGFVRVPEDRDAHG